VTRGPISLIYHDVARTGERSQAGFETPVADAYKLEPGLFSAHLRAIKGTGVHVGCYDERPQAMLTFDDGGASSLPIADELERHGFRGTFFVVTGRLGTPGFLDQADVRDLVRRGHQVGSHSHTHPAYMARLPTEDVRDEWQASREVLGEILGFAPPLAAVPGGSVSAIVAAEVARAGYTHMFTSTPRARIITQAGIEVWGRYTMWASDSPQRAAALVSRRLAPRVRRWMGWQLKSGLKRVAPAAYEAARAGRASARKDASRAT
jgi:peptidoglycan/xylan/chitin deacetylase (PgdA/CDA1 family)